MIGGGFVLFRRVAVGSGRLVDLVIVLVEHEFGGTIVRGEQDVGEIEPVAGLPVPLAEPTVVRHRAAQPDMKQFQAEAVAVERPTHEVGYGDVLQRAEVALHVGPAGVGRRPLGLPQ
jgi:hypothetical protein